jgi:hypothetical protein
LQKSFLDFCNLGLAKVNFAKSHGLLAILDGSLSERAIPGAHRQFYNGLLYSTTYQTRSIATATDEQAAACDEISRGVNSINVISSATFDTMQQSTHLVSQITDQALLKKLITDLKDGGRLVTKQLGQN